jgi:hypothetical protein
MYIDVHFYMNTFQVLEHLEGRSRTVGRNCVTCRYAYTVLEIITKQFLFYAVRIEADTSFYTSLWRYTHSCSSSHFYSRDVTNTSVSNVPPITLM